MAEETAHAARMRRETAADEGLTALLYGLKAFFEGHATLHISTTPPGLGTSIRFIKDKP